MGNPKGNDVKEVRVSEASRKDARGGNSYREVLAAIKEMEEERRALGGRKLQLQARHAELNSKVAGRRLPAAEYQMVCEERAEMAREMADVDRRIPLLNARLHELRSELNDYEKEDTRSETNELLRKILVELEILNGRRRAT